ncbi:MAG: SpoIIE family protein phosphatase, partial [Bacteroidetes bacterium]|nr:SpoIIE family protein phosphatase [Bacteroidota bacterium]
MNFYIPKLTDKIFLLSVLFFMSFSLKAQKYYFDVYSVKEGLAQSSVHAIKQDNQGYLWIGTASGLSKFNGKDFTNYTTEDGLSDGAVKSIYIDKTQTIWTGHTDGGVSRIIGDKKKTVLNIGADITSMAEDDEGNLWITSFKSGAIKITNPYINNVDSIKFKQYKGQEGLSDIVFQVIKLKNGTICFVTDVGVKYYNSQKEEFTKFVVKDMPLYFQIIYMYERTNGDLWFGTYNGGVYEYNKSENSFKIYDVRDGLASNWVTSIYEDTKNNLWIGTWGGGITKVNHEKMLISITPANGLIDDKIRCIAGDREGNVLFGTKENGLLLYKGEQFVAYTKEEGLVDNQVWAILKDNNNYIWIGTNKGISKIKDNKIVKNYNENNGLPFQEVRFIKQDKLENIWIGTWGGGVMQYNSKLDKFEVNFRINSFMYQPLITALDVDKLNNLWVGTTDGLVYYEIKNQLADRLTQNHGLAGNDITVVFADSKNNVWVGSRGKGISKIKNADIKKINLNNNFTPTCIAEDNKGNLLIGTEGKGILVFDGEKIIKEITTKNGLLSDYISLINIDDEGNSWIGTNKGLNKFDVKAKKFYSYSQKMGFIGIESKSNATFKDQQGILWFGTIQGAIKLNTKEINENLLEPVTFITRLRVNLEDRKLTDNLTLTYREKSITFDYNSICLTNPDQVYYQVMLEGADEDWRPLTQQTFATYSPLPPGKYTFKVKASNNNDIWNATPVTFSFEITPPLWQRTWFILLCAFVLLIVVVFFVKYREQQLLKEKQLLEVKVKERTEEVVQKSAEIEQKNKDIIDSITYAKRIQDSILPSDETFVKELNQTFVLFNPKDIVSGDFYWLYTKEDKILFAAVDCTGHGVPGAFMSIVGYNLLDKIVGEEGVLEPSEILNRLNKGVENTFKKEAEKNTIKDGMDIALCAFDKTTQVLEFSGAYNPLYIVSKTQLDAFGETIEPDLTENDLNLFEIKANRFPIGSFSENQQKYTNQRFKLNHGDTIYLFSDGFADQFGGPDGKKFRYKQFKQLLLTIYPKPMEEQYIILQQTFNDWKG